MLVMGELLNFLNDDSSCNELIKNEIFHYYFGYIHPFYDGNGRTARFISSIYLKEDKELIEIMKIAIELHLFGSYGDYIDIELLKEQNILNYTNQTIRKKLNKLFELKLLNKISKNPVRYVLNPNYLEQ